MAQGEESNEEKVTLTSRTEDLQSKDILTVASNLTTLASDYVKVLIDDECQLCTFVFFRKHIKPKQTDRGILLDSINHEAFLEVKVPFESAFQLSLYMETIFKEKQKHKNDDGYAYIRFGPGDLRSGS
jgi:hypothetical protein